MDVLNHEIVLLAIYFVGLACFMAEVFIPSGGVLGIAGVLCVGYPIWMLFANDNPVLGSGCVGLTLAYGVFLVRWGLQRVTSMEDLAESSSTGRDVKAASELIGRVGEAVTALRPAGVAVIEGRRFDVVTRGAFVESGTPVEVLETQGNRIVVRSV
jgi:membrane-bound serine protease (ClpP class)